MPGQRIVIAGASLCGSHAAETLRDEGFEGEIVLVGAEAHLPYDRPPLSKTYQQAGADETPDDPTYNPESFYADKRIELQLGRAVTAVDPGARRITLAGGSTLAYDQLLLATGSRVRRLTLPGADLAGVHYLRTLDDANALRAALATAKSAVVVGAGFIGSEIAASAKMRGLDVTILEVAKAPLARALGEEVGLLLGGLHTRRGVTLHLGEGVTELRGNGRVQQVVTSTGRVLDADLVVVGVGVDPITDYLATSGIATGNGIIVDELCRTGTDGVFAAGDAANWPHRPTGARLRVEHWDHAWNQAETAAKAMLGKGEAYDPVLYFWSDQYDVEIQYLGHARSWDKVVLRGDVEGETFAAFYLEGGLLRAVMSIGRPEAETDAMREMLAKGARPAPEALADEGTDLASLV